MKRALIVLVALQLLALGAYFLLRPGPPGPPDFEFERADGAVERLSGRRGRPQIVHLWATWCDPCVKELPGLLAYVRETGAPVLAVSLDDDWAKVRAFLPEGVPPAVVRAREDGVAARFGVPGLPATIVVGADGAVRARRLGAIDWASPEARAKIEAETGG
jgi:thiol-disulfide isomerase/thioredoxin